MPEANIDRSNKVIGLIIISVAIILGAIIGMQFFDKKEAPPVPETAPQEKTIPEEPSTVMDYNALEDDSSLNTLMQDRKAKYGIEKGIDMVVRSDESLKVGDRTISMQKILDETRIKRGEFVEKDIAGSQTRRTDQKIEEFGIYIVQPGDNIWNIHFRVLQSYFDHRRISLSPLADEPGMDGGSSGVGKILKFSENMVYIYNLRDNVLDTDINLLQPLSKAVVYRMSEVFALLDQIDYETVNRIQFDGENLWIPGEQ